MPQQTANVIREAFLARSEPDSANRLVDEFMLDQFDQAGLGEHPTFLKFLATTVNIDAADWKTAKNAAYSVLGKARAKEQLSIAPSAKMFFEELLGSVETLASIADDHGARTLADLMYLQNAILGGGFIDHYPDESSVLDIASALPSGDIWAQYIKVEYLAKPVV